MGQEGNEKIAKRNRIRNTIFKNKKYLYTNKKWQSNNQNAKKNTKKRDRKNNTTKIRLD